MQYTNRGTVCSSRGAEGDTLLSLAKVPEKALCTTLSSVKYFFLYILSLHNVSKIVAFKATVIAFLEMNYSLKACELHVNAAVFWGDKSCDVGKRRAMA